MVFEKIRKIISEKFELSEDNITEQTDIVEDLEADSLDMADLISSLEGEFGVEISLEDVKDFKNLGDISNYIESKIR
ncbi:MAG: acyl carrier protein [Candidatus Improbicoccus pseudotrichonymphae]|uniref:Acyl carrier protein n=1 Tax=Candidatus Improbicoccus pseudotrichonymphae TaxID=3033792 RepID=A0AA48HXX1_9FIRM|nr:MAG: acyl carrier protein [Candidatus Improbicoccus pseudotrichonymphae]